MENHELEIRIARGHDANKLAVDVLQSAAEDLTGRKVLRHSTFFNGGGNQFVELLCNNAFWIPVAIILKPFTDAVLAKFGDKVGEILIDALNTRKTEAKFDEKKFNELVASMQALISLNHGVSVGFPSINGAGHFNMCVRLRSASFEELAEAAFFFAAIGEPLEALKEEYAAKGYSLTSGTIDLETMQVRMSFAAGKDHSNLPERVLSVSLEEDGTVTVARLSSW